MLIGCHTCVNLEMELSLLLLGNYDLYKPLFTLGLCRVADGSKGLTYLPTGKYRHVPVLRNFYIRKWDHRLTTLNL